MSFLPEPDHVHGRAPSIGVLLVNLGTPDAPTPAATRRYLAQFLSDPRVIEIPGEGEEHQHRTDQQRIGFEVQEDIEQRVEPDQHCREEARALPAFQHRRAVKSEQPDDRRRCDHIGEGKADHLGERQQQYEEQHQSDTGQQIFRRRDARARDDVEHQEGDEGEADEQEAIFDAAIDLAVEVDGLDQADRDRFCGAARCLASAAAVARHLDRHRLPIGFARAVIRRDRRR